MNDSKKFTILYVDDDPDFRDSMRTVLEANGYLFAEAATGEEGLRVFRSESPDLVILDLMMEEVDTGTTMVRDLKLAGCEAPIFVISSVGDALRESTNTTELGLAGVLQKPVDFDDLLMLIKTKLSKRDE
jgi:DNA-binding response OmpR family regulator